MNRDDELLKEQTEDTARLKKLYSGARQGIWTWQASGAMFGLAGGAVAAILGAVLLFVALIAGDQSEGLSLHGIGNILLLSTIPLLILGACCLDLLEKQTEKSEPPITDDAKKAAKMNSHPALPVVIIAAFLVLLCGMYSNNQAQQTVFNVPTTDVLEAEKVYVEVDISAKPVEPKFSSFVPRLVIGVGGRVEVGVNITGNIQPGVDSTTIVPAVKWKVYDGKDNGWTVAVGNNLFIPVRNKSYDIGTYAYTMIQKKFSTGTRIGAGGYFFSKNVVAPNANRAGGQFTFEQPVTGRFGLQADWFTGKHANGYFTPGGYFKITPKLTGYGAYSIGNSNAMSGNHFLYFEVGYNFN